ncbi:hypothetical protein RCH10_005579 [Variovorax sp. GrIS 2.14]|uniref:hypothetical protein n=1 Tax=Variovorax sp. GrIS 2.14 TaxID=3071709 RepID=UPI0038F612D4
MTLDSTPVLSVPSVSRFQGCIAIDVVAAYPDAVTFDIEGAAPFLRHAESLLMRSSNSALLGGHAVVLRRSTWTQPMGSTKMRVNCRYSPMPLVN